MKYTDIKVGQLLLSHYRPSYSKDYRVAGSELVEVIGVGVTHSYHVIEGGWAGHSARRDTDRGIRVRRIHPESVRPTVQGQTQEEAVEAAREPFVTRAELLQPYDGSNREQWDAAQERRRAAAEQRAAKEVDRRELVDRTNQFLPADLQLETITVPTMEHIRALVEALEAASA